MMDLGKGKLICSCDRARRSYAVRTRPITYRYGTRLIDSDHIVIEVDDFDLSRRNHRLVSAPNGGPSAEYHQVKVSISFFPSATKG